MSFSGCFQDFLFQIYDFAYDVPRCGVPYNNSLWSLLFLGSVSLFFINFQPLCFRMFYPSLFYPLTFGRSIYTYMRPLDTVLFASGHYSFSFFSSFSLLFRLITCIAPPSSLLTAVFCHLYSTFNLNYWIFNFN